jgi:riboflavin transporter
MRSERLRLMVRIAMLGALAVLFMLVQFEIGFGPYLKYDLADVPALIAALTMGPIFGVIVEALKAVLYFLLGLSKEGPVGVEANFLVGSILVLSVGYAHRLLLKSGLKHWSFTWLFSMASVLVMAAVSLPLLAVIIFPQWGMSGAAGWAAAATASTPFNLVKGALSTALSLLLFRRLQPYMIGSSPKSGPVIRRQAS